MTIERVPATNLTYYLIAYDAEGKERTDDPDGLISQRVLEVLKNEPVTDVFMMSHGWQGDIPAARTQYAAWISAMTSCPDDLAQLQRERPTFHPLLIGFHWPSLAWGNEDLGNVVSFSQPTEVSELDDVIDAYAKRLADTPAARAALNTLFTTALSTPAPVTLPEDIRTAYTVLEQESKLEYNGVGAAPGMDQEGFDPEWIFSAALQQSFGPGAWATDALLAPLRVLSFWKMKERAHHVGERAGFSLLQALQQAPTRSESVRIHLMGHSFGCIVISAALNGLDGRGDLLLPVASVMLVQGALSLWAYSTEIPPAPGQVGFFHSLVAQKKIAGPLITTQSTFDRAVGFFYPLGAGLMQQVSFAPGDFPTYGGVGSFGIQGPQLDSVAMPLLPLTESYTFEPGKIYNLESSAVICHGDGPSGAHSDIAHPEVAHAFWQAIGLSG